MKKLFKLFLASFVTLSLVGCANGENKEKSTKDMKVVALSYSVADMMKSAGGNVVGVTSDATRYDAFKNTQSVGSLMRPDSGTIISLKPDLVLLTGDIPTHKRLKVVLEKAKVKCEVVDVNSYEDYSKYMKEFTTQTNREDLYKKNVEEVSKRIEDVKKKVNFKKQTYLMLRVSSAKNKVLKKEYFATRIMNDMNMTNIADDNSQLDTINVEEIVKRDPDYIFVVAQGGTKKAEEAYNKIAAHNSWKSLSAVKNKKVKVLPKKYFHLKPNSNWDKAYEYAYKLLA